jgi:hypothetical protein
MAADPRTSGKSTYISSLITDDDGAACGLYLKGSVPLFVGNVSVKNAIVFPDGTTQSSAGVALPDHIDCGGF